jgi:hypothetical protein
MDIAQQFAALADEWEKHCRDTMWSSNTDDYLDHPSYRRLIELGPPAVPHIIDRYKLDFFPWWSFVLQEITGVQEFSPRSFAAIEMQEYWLAWWERTQAAKQQ